jgi:hypothetical protein
MNQRFIPTIRHYHGMALLTVHELAGPPQHITCFRARSNARRVSNAGRLQPSCAASASPSGGDYTTELAAAERRWEDQASHLCMYRLHMSH